MSSIESHLSNKPKQCILTIYFSCFSLLFWTNTDELFTDSDDENESKEKEKKKTSDTTDDSKKKNEIKPKAVVKPTVDFTKKPMVLAARAIMEALRRLALGNAEEQEDVRFFKM